MTISPDQAFSHMGLEYETESLHNPIVSFARKQVYRHFLRLRKPPATVLEINAGSGYDALYLATMGYKVLATDSASGMINMIYQKRHQNLNALQMSFHKLELTQKFDIILSNFGGLNTTSNIAKVFKQFPNLLNKGGYVVLTILNPFCIWEFANLPWSWKTATRRLNWLKKKPTKANIGGNVIDTYYYSPAQIQKAMPPVMRLVEVQGLSIFVPPPYMKQIPRRYPKIFDMLTKIEMRLCSFWPFSHLGDYFIISFRLEI